MKKGITVIVIITIIALLLIGYIFSITKQNNDKIKSHNSTFEKYLGKELYGSDISTIINKAIDINEKNKIEKDKDGKYIENDMNSIKINLKMKDNDNIYAMETIYKNKIEEFMKYYGPIKFKCTNIEYHQKTKMIKKMIFEQILT